MPGYHNRDPRSVRAVRPGLASEFDIDEWDRKRRASEHLPIMAPRPEGGRQTPAGRMGQTGVKSRPTVFDELFPGMRKGRDARRLGMQR